MFSFSVDKNSTVTIKIELGRLNLLKKEKAYVNWAPPWTNFFEGVHFGEKPSTYDQLSMWAYARAPGFIRIAGLEMGWIDAPADILKKHPEALDLGIPRPSRATPVKRVEIVDNVEIIRMVTDRGEAVFPRDIWFKLANKFRSMRMDKQGFTWITPELKVPNPVLMCALEGFQIHA